MLLTCPRRLWGRVLSKYRRAVARPHRASRAAIAIVAWLPDPRTRDSFDGVQMTQAPDPQGSEGTNASARYRRRRGIFFARRSLRASRIRLRGLRAYGHWLATARRVCRPPIPFGGRKGRDSRMSSRRDGTVASFGTTRLLTTAAFLAACSGGGRDANGVDPVASHAAPLSLANAGGGVTSAASPIVASLSMPPWTACTVYPTGSNANDPSHSAIVFAGRDGKIHFTPPPADWGR
jgi:hypothetical protein